MKTKHIIAVFCGMFLFESFLSAQTEEFRFKLYMESLSSGKKDTLELGIGPNGIVGCDYDSTLCTVYTDPFFDTVEHIGAFIVDDQNLGNWDACDRYDHRLDTIRVNCPMYVKKRVGKMRYDMVIIFPLSELPIMFSWDQSLLQDPSIQRPVFTNWVPGRRWDVAQGEIWRPRSVKDMSKVFSYVLENYGQPGEYVDSLTFLTYIQDSLGQEHAYRHMFICLGEQPVSINQTEKIESFVKILPNPVKKQFVWKSEFPIRHWQIFTQNGSLVLSGDGKKREVNCFDWASGIYYWRGISFDDKVSVVKFIKR